MFLFQSTLPIQGETMRPGLRLATSYSFQSTLPIQGETKPSHLYTGCTDISIHSPYTGRDFPTSCITLDGEYFNPLSLYRERRFQALPYSCWTHFNPLSLYRERQEDWCFEICFWYFNPLSLYRERRTPEAYVNMAMRFQSTLPIQGETPACNPG